jgi:hypothetical protein
VHDTWAARDLPVLDATVRLMEASYMVTVSDIAAETGLAEQAVARALEALDPVYVDFRKTTTGGDPTFWYVLKVTPAARQAVGQWPTAETLIGSLAAELTAAARDERDAERKGLLSYAARLVGDTLRAVSVRAAEAVLAPAVAAMRPAEASAAAGFGSDAGSGSGLDSAAADPAAAGPAAAGGRAAKPLAADGPG